MKKTVWFSMILMAAILGTGCGNSSSGTQAATETAATAADVTEAAEKEETAPKISYTPEKNMTMFAAYKVGGGVDVFGREIAAMMENNGLYDSRFLYDNIDGASGQVGLAAIKNQHDGDESYLISCSTTLLNSAYTSGKEEAYGYRDLTLLAQLCVDYRCYVVPAQSQFETMEDLVEYGKSNELVGAISGVGGIGHVGLERLASDAGIKIRNVPFNGTSDVIAAILGNQVDVAVEAIPSAVEYAEAGKLKILAVASPERVENLPDVPTLKELGYDIELPTSRGIAMPANVSEEAEEYWIGQLKALSETEEFAKYCEENGYYAEFASGDDYVALMDADCEATTEIMKAIGLYGVN